MPLLELIMIFLCLQRSSIIAFDNYVVWFLHCFFICRWTRLRLTMEPFPQCLEPLTECFVIGILMALAVSHLMNRSVLLSFAQHCLFWFVSDEILLKIVQGVRLFFTSLYAKCSARNDDVITQRMNDDL